MTVSLVVSNVKPIHPAPFVTSAQCTLSHTAFPMLTLSLHLTSLQALHAN